MRPELLLPQRLGRQIRRTEGDVMDSAAGLPAAITNTGKDINQGTGAATGHAEPGSLPLLTGQAHAEQLGQHRGRRVELPLRQGDRMQAADRMLGGDVGDPVPTGAMITFRGHEIDHHAVGITEGEHLLLVAGTRVRRCRSPTA